jgi:hypothetical protein
MWLAVLGLIALGAQNNDRLHAGVTSSSWVIVVNGASQNSRTIANHYVQLRNIPWRNVIILKDIPATETISENDFKTKILQPVLKQIDDRQLAAHVQGIAYSCDIPTRITVTPAKQIPAGKEAWFSPVASINSATYLYQPLLSGHSIVSLYNNFYCRIPVDQSTQLPLNDAMRKELVSAKKSEDQTSPSSQTESKEGGDAGNGEQPAVSKEFLEKYVQKYPYQASAWFQLAVLAAEAGEEDTALGALAKAIDMGWAYRELIKAHPAFKSLQSNSKYQTLLIACEDAPTDWTEPRGFDARLSITPNSVETTDQTAGMRYMLSIVLAATQPLGNTMDQAIESLRASAAADYTHPKGTFYFTLTSDVRTKAREPLFDLAIEKLKKAGFVGKEVHTLMPIGEDDVVGVTMGAASFAWIASGSKIIPGAIADNLTSFNGAMHLPGQTKLSEYLAHGAAGASGAVNEPFSLQAKFPLPLIHESYARGETLAEAFYQSLMGPYQMLIVGDPLCQPWANPPEIKVSGFDIEKNITSPIELVVESTAESSADNPAALLILGDGVVKAGGKSRINVRIDPAEQNLLGWEELRIISQSNSRMRTRSEKVLELCFGNPEDQLELIVPEKIDADAARKFEIKINRPRDFDVTIIQNSEIWTKIKAGSTSATIDISNIGKGPIRIQAIATSGNQKVKSRFQWVTLE